MSEHLGDADGVGEQGDEPDASGRKPPKLTIGQRILTALPNLDRQGPAAEAPTARASAGRTSGRTTTRPPSAQRRAPEHDTDVEADESSAVAEEPIEPDEVTEPSAQRASSGPRRTSESAATTGGGARGGGAGARGRTDATAGMSNEELSHAIKRIDDRERRYTMMAGFLGIVMGIVVTIAAIHYNPLPRHKGHEADSVIWSYGAARLVLGGLVALTSYSRRRSLVAFALLFLGTAMGNPLFALPFWALGGWMIWRVFRYQKELTARGAGPQRGRTTQSRARQNRASESRTAVHSGTRSRPSAAARGGATDARERVARSTRSRATSGAAGRSCRRVLRLPSATRRRNRRARGRPRPLNEAPSVPVVDASGGGDVSDPCIDEKSGPKQPQDLLTPAHE